MQKFLVLVFATLLVTSLAGCSTVRCAGQSVGRASSVVACGAKNTWNRASCAMNRAADCSCRPEIPERVTCPVYADCCGGDTGIGRGGTGAFAIPAGPGD